jgi:hypothetical protein
MAYVILHRERGARGLAAKWKALGRIADSEHQARDMQRNAEQHNPKTETARVWVELPG